MAVYEVFSHPVLQQYKTHIFSKASFVHLILTLLTIILPFLVVYRTNEFWLKEIHFREQPKISFKKELIFVLYLAPNQSFITYSTYPNYNNLQQKFLRVPLIKAREEDETGDGINDYLKLDLEVPLFDSEQVVGVEMLLFFRYELRKYNSFLMDSMAYIQYSSALPGAKLQVLGNLQMRQRELLLSYMVNRRYNFPVVDSNSIFSEAYDLPKILEKYYQRNITTELVSPYYTWIIGRGTKRPFTISVLIKYPEDEFVFMPGFMYQLKWGWVQYVSVLILFILLFDKIKIYLYRNRLVNTIILNPFKTN